MAGIGFELRKLVRDDSLSGWMRAYGYAGLIAAGPWVFSILSVLLVGVVATATVSQPILVTRFLVSVTYLMAASLIVTGPLQLLFSRFVADRVYEKRQDRIVPNLFGALLLCSVTSGLLGAAVLALFFTESFQYQLLMLATFVTLCDIWLLVVLLSGMKAYHSVLVVYAAGSIAGLGASILLRSWGVEGLLAGFFFGQAIQMFAMLAIVVQAYACNELIRWDFLRRRHAFLTLSAVGLLYNLGIWADKIIFWMNPGTSEPVIGPLRSSVVYDLPIFLAYLSIIPGMAVFLMRIETDFAEQYDTYFATIRNGRTLDEIEQARHRMTSVVRQALYDIFKVQGATVVGIALTGPWILAAFDISPLYLPLLYVDAVGVGAQVLFVAVLSVLFYLDKRHVALAVTTLFFVSNVLLSALTLRLGPDWYGYGFAVSVSISSLAGLVLLSRKIERLEFETFMAQG